MLALRDDPTKQIYATLEVDGLQAQIDTPLEEHTPEEELRQIVNLSPTSSGDMDPGAYCKALAYLNRRSTGADTPDQVTERFFDMLHLAHGQTYGSVQMDTHGGFDKHGYHHYVMIRPLSQEFRTDLEHTSVAEQIDNATGFTQLVEASLPHVTVTPLPVETYLREVQAIL